MQVTLSGAALVVASATPAVGPATVALNAAAAPAAPVAATAAQAAAVEPSVASPVLNLHGPSFYGMGFILAGVIAGLVYSIHMFNSKRNGKAMLESATAPQSCTTSA